MGPTVILLERLVTRDRWTAEQAIELLRVNHGVVIDDGLKRFSERLASRGPARQFVSEEEAGQIESDSPRTDATVVRAEQDFLAKRVQTALDRARQALDPEDRLILRMRFEDGVPVADIARALHFDQKRLYRRIDRLLVTVGASLEREGISRLEVRALLADDAVGWDRASAGSGAVGGRSGPRPIERARER
jgi:hypothetical protein